MPQILRRRAGGVPPMQMERYADWLGRVGWRGGREGVLRRAVSCPVRPPCGHTHTHTHECMLMGRRGWRESARLGWDGLDGEMCACLCACLPVYTYLCRAHTYIHTSIPPTSSAASLPGKGRGGSCRRMQPSYSHGPD